MRITTGRRSALLYILGSGRGGASVSDPKTAGRDLRALWATLAVICLLGAGVAYGITRYRLMELEQEAGQDARKLAVDVIQPALTAGDVSAPIRGERLGEVRSAIEEMKVELCQGVEFVDIYEGKGLADDERSLTIRLEYRSPERTLVDEEVDAVHAGILKSLEEKLGIKPRF